ncbi:MAG TPA: hypothetical protein VKA41_04570 [Solirubrobacterales bacterium]|nr:hypothetical protein [Solirubrobacterales bacterium]
MGDDPARFFAESFADVWVPGLRRLLNERFGAHLARFAWGQMAHRNMRGVSESEKLDVVTGLAYQWL